MRDNLENEYKIEPREGEAGWFDAYKSGEWVDASPSREEAQVSVNEWRNNQHTTPINS